LFFNEILIAIDSTTGLLFRSPFCIKLKFRNPLHVCWAEEATYCFA